MKRQRHRLMLANVALTLGWFSSVSCVAPCHAAGVDVWGVPPNSTIGAGPPPAPNVVHLEGSATWFNNQAIARLTPAILNISGAAWYALEKTPVADGFQVYFTFKISEPGGFASGLTRETGADGFAFVIQNHSSSALGDRQRGGSGIGYNGIPNSLAIEFDTWATGPGDNGDPLGNHIGVLSQGRLPNSPDHRLNLVQGKTATTQIPNLRDGKEHQVAVIYQPDSLQVRVDDLTTPLLTVAVDLSSLLDLDSGKAWVGFTAATGGAFENHDIPWFHVGPLQ